MKTAIIILGHGSRSTGADEAIKQIAGEVKRFGTFEIVAHAFLQYASPSLNHALEDCIQKQATKVIIVPFLMQSGTHVANDIPALMMKAKQRHPDVDIQVTDHVGAHPLMIEIVKDLANKSR